MWGHQKSIAQYFQEYNCFVLKDDDNFINGLTQTKDMNMPQYVHLQPKQHLIFVQISIQAYIYRVKEGLLDLLSKCTNECMPMVEAIWRWGQLPPEPDLASNLQLRARKLMWPVQRW